jgi:hypothetical protein
MRVPEKIPGLKWATAVLAIYFALWISLEGMLWRAVLMGIGATAVSLGHLAQKYLAGHRLSWQKWVGLTAILGLLFGLGSSTLTLLFMAVKTGLHAHGPEFNLNQIQWILAQTPLWATVGLLAGTGIGFLTAQK